MGEPQDKIVNPRIALNSRTSRLLRGDVDIDMKEKYDILKDEIMNMEDDEDEYNFERRLKLLMQNDKFEKQFNTIRSNENDDNYDQFYDSYECVHKYGNLYDSSESVNKYEILYDSNEGVNKYNNMYDSNEAVQKYDNMYDSSESVDSCDKSFDKTKYDDEYGKLNNSQDSIYSQIHQYNGMKYKLPAMDMYYRRKKKSIFSRIWKVLKKTDAHIEREMYNVMNNDIPRDVKEFFGGIRSRESIKLIKLFTIFSPVISIASMMFLLVLLNFAAPVAIVGSCIKILFVIFPIVLTYVLYKYKKCKHLSKLYGSRRCPRKYRRKRKI
ncbi:Pv-fam-d protein [Plasmodium vivax Brazil I]|uniref:Pv-fam-d protein n=1 Tax=Plasmodium vivax (strain Brazil I) TaxID=1033975 RepID=A0A0J9T1R6_PLAV1|nr:Pv-fam-d protein [Plasmodium vivax Brazil I]